MATVRLTQDIRYEVDRKLRDGFETRKQQVIETARQSIDWNQLVRDVRAWVLETHGMTEALLAQVPPGWINRVSQIQILSINNVSLPYALSYLDTSDMPVPYDWNAQHVPLSDPSFDAVSARISALNDQLTSIHNEQRTVRRLIDNIWHQCKTLKQALELWPGLLTLVPQGVVDQHNAPPEKREKVAKVFDTSSLEALNAAAVKNQIATVTAS